MSCLAHDARQAGTNAMAPFVNSGLATAVSIMGHATRILIVDDDPLMRFALGQTLSDSGCEVAEAADGAAATRAVTGAPDRFDVVLLDDAMPDSRDLQLLSRLRSLSPASRVIMMTTHPTPALVASATQGGAVCVLNKPIDFDELCRLVTS